MAGAYIKDDNPSGEFAICPIPLNVQINSEGLHELVDDGGENSEEEDDFSFASDNDVDAGIQQVKDHLLDDDVSTATVGRFLTSPPIVWEEQPEKNLKRNSDGEGKDSVKRRRQGDKRGRGHIAKRKKTIKRRRKKNKKTRKKRIKKSRKKRIKKRIKRIKKSKKR